MKKLIAIVVAFASAGAARAQLQTALFPLEVGNRWTYVVHNGTDIDASNKKKTVVVEVERREPYEKNVGFILKNTSDAKVTRDHVVVLPDGVYRVHVAETPITPPVCLIKLGDKSNTWQSNSKSGATTLKGTFTVKGAKVAVPAGAYDSAILVHFTNGLNGEKRINIDAWYVLNIGLVKQRTRMGASEIVQELEKFESRKK